jgi:DNA-binding NarL/FixJ family response regulator
VSVAIQSEPSWIQPGARSARTAGLRVLVVDEHEVVGWGFRLLLGRRAWVERCFTARSADEALSVAQRHEPQLVLIEGGLAEATSLPERLHSVLPASRVVLTTAERASVGREVVCTASSARELVGAVERAAHGLMPLGTAEEADGRPELSGREHEILELMSEGETNREIAARLFLSPYTVKQHTTAVYRKLGVRNRTEAAQRARRLGLIA